MAGRFSQFKPFERCFNPITIFHDGVKYVVPCGRCESCRLDKANNWSLRLSDEIEHCPYPIFFTLTYNNKYLPRLRQSVVKDGDFVKYLISPASDNVRFDGVKDVPRTDDFSFLSGSPLVTPKIQNYSLDTDFSYSSKRDIQLWLKNLRKDVNLYFNNLDNNGKIIDKQKTLLRYFIISEYGPTTFRSHYHGFVFLFDREVAEYVLRLSLYKNWQMCDKTLFDQYAHYCDGGASGYVTQYVNSFTHLPQVLKHKSISPFRLSSKNPSIGFHHYEPEEIYEKIFSGTIEFIKTISDIQKSYVLPYPSLFMSRLFPKCERFSLLSYNRLYSVYGKLYRYVFKRGYSYTLAYDFLRKELKPADWYATKTCYNFCVVHGGCSPHVYLYLLDMYYYKVQMCTLKRWYEWQENTINNNLPLVLVSYNNLSDYYRNFYSLPYYKRSVLSEFLSGFGIDVLDFVDNNVYDSFVVSDDDKRLFKLEVTDIIDGMVKMSKFNELTGNSPHIV